MIIQRGAVYQPREGDRLDMAKPKLSLEQTRSLQALRDAARKLGPATKPVSHTPGQKRLEDFVPLLPVEHIRDRKNKGIEVPNAYHALRRETLLSVLRTAENTAFKDKNTSKPVQRLLRPLLKSLYEDQYVCIVKRNDENKKEVEYCLFEPPVFHILGIFRYVDSSFRGQEFVALKMDLDGRIVQSACKSTVVSGD